MSLARIKKDDTVIVKSGEDAGKTGTVLKVNVKDGTALVSGVNKQTKAMRRTEKQAGGLIEMECPIKLSKLMPYDAEAKAGTRVKAGEKDGKKARVAVKSGKAL